VVNSSVPATSRGSERPDRRPGQWLGLAVLAIGIAVATVIVPPLITPRHDRPPAAPAAPVFSASPAASATQGPVAARPPARFTPITVQAEDPGNTLTGGAVATDCVTCRGGGRVRYVCLACQVVVRATVPVAGARTVTVVYEADGRRALKVSVNGAAARTWQVTGPGWETPRTLRFTADLPAGPLRLALFNDDTAAPDVDEVVIS
jgi:hypothetical protein